MDTNYGMEIVRATEISALTAARQQGLGDHLEILSKARSALAKTLNRLNIEGVIINDRFRKRSDLFQMPESVGKGGARMDLMAIAIEAHHSAADGGTNATSYAVIAPQGVIQSVPNLSMYKIVVGPQVGNVIDINQPPVTNVKRVARALRKYTWQGVAHRIETVFSRLDAMATDPSDSELERVDLGSTGGPA